MYRHLLFICSFVVLCACTSEEPVPRYTLQVTSSSPGGTVTGAIPNKKYRSGEVVTLTAHPNEHWVFKSWKLNASGNENPLRLVMNSDKAIEAEFEIKSYPLVITIVGSGTVEEKKLFNPNSRLYPFNTLIELTPIPKEGWEFEKWEGDLAGYDIPKRILIDKEKNVKAVFVPEVLEKFILHPNGVTCMCPNARPGKKGEINGVIYEAVDNALLRVRRDQNADMTKLCTSLVTDMSGLFQGSVYYSKYGDLLNWNTFNQPIDHWDVSNVTTMKRMFSLSLFNQPLSHWDVSNVVDMTGMFASLTANSTHPPSTFNQPLENWNVSNVTSMDYMFSKSSFDQPIGKWDVSNVVSMRNMFNGTTFNQDISNWDVSKVTRMDGMFAHSLFNKDISKWNMSQVSSLECMFCDSKFNQPIGNWDVSNVKMMRSLFSNSHFNQSLENWNVSSVEDMHWMFYSSPFNLPINKWCVKNIKEEPIDFSTGSPLTPANKPIWGTCPD